MRFPYFYPGKEQYYEKIYDLADDLSLDGHPACRLRTATYSNKEEEICDAYLDFLEKYGTPPYTANDFSVRFVYETQNACAVFIHAINSMYMDMVRTETVSGLCFTFPNSQLLYIYCDKNFYRLEEAFTQGILTADELTELHQAYKDYRNARLNRS